VLWKGQRFREGEGKVVASERRGTRNGRQAATATIRAITTTILVVVVILGTMVSGGHNGSRHMVVVVVLLLVGERVVW